MDLIKESKIHVFNDNFSQNNKEKRNKYIPVEIFRDKLIFLNKGNTTKEIILDCYIQMIEQYYILKRSKLKDAEPDFNSEYLSDLYERLAHLKYIWNPDSDNRVLTLKMEEKEKRQLIPKGSGLYFTPIVLSNFMAKISIKHISKKKIKELKIFLTKVKQKGVITHEKKFLNNLKNIISIKIIDISAGTGNFLRSTIHYLVNHFKNVNNIVLKFNESKLFALICLSIPFLTNNSDIRNKSNSLIHLYQKSAYLG